METELGLKEVKKEWHGTYKSYIIGLVYSLLFTGSSFLLVATRLLSGNTLVYTIIAFALLQAICQLRYFLHLGHEAKPRWETLVFYFMLLVLLIIVMGSLWIMFDLNHRLMPHMANGM